MSFCFVYTNDYSVGIMQLMAILKESKIKTDLVLSRYDYIEVSYLQYVAQTGNRQEREKAGKVLRIEQKRIAEEIMETGPAVVGFSVATDLYQFYLQIARILKKNINYPIVMGGPHPTFSPQHVLDQECVDALCVGEVDASIVSIYGSLVNGKKKKSIPGLWLKKDGEYRKKTLTKLIKDLDSLPFPEIDAFAKINEYFVKVYHVATARGCPFNCSYCNSNSYKKLYRDQGNYLRKRNPQNVIREIKLVLEKYPVQEVRFTDDVFTMDSKWLYEFLDLYGSNIGLPFYCLIHPDMAKDDMLKIIGEARCHTVKIGVQTINPNICKQVYNRSLNVNNIIRVVNKLKSLSIKVKLDFIIGGPTETEDDLMDLVSFIRDIDVDDIFLYFLKYYPGSDIIDYSLDQGYLNREYISRINAGLELPYQVIPSHFSRNKRALYAKYNDLLREAAGSAFRIDNFAYLLEA